MSVIGNFLKALIPREKPTGDMQAWGRASTLISEQIQTKFNLKPDQMQMMLAAVGYIHITSALNASFCAHTPVRLMTKGKPAAGAKLGRKRHAFLRSGVLGKSAAYADRAGDMVEVLDHPAMALLSNPNNLDTGIEYRTLGHYFANISGNQYWQHNATTSKPPTIIKHLQPQWTNVRPDEDGVATYYDYGRNRTAIVTLPAESVVHFRRFPSPWNPLMGVGDYHAVAREAGIIQAALMYEESFWANSARPDAIIKVAVGTPPAVIDQIRAAFMGRHRGPNKGHEPLIGNDLEVMPLGWAPKDMDYKEGYLRMKQAIFHASGVTIAMLDPTESSISIGAGAAASSARTIYLSQTILPRMAAWCEALNEKYLPLFGVEPGEMWFAPDNPVPEDEEKEAEAARADVAAAIRTINEVREERGDKPLPGGDDLRYAGKSLAVMDAPPALPGEFGDPGAKAVDEIPVLRLVKRVPNHAHPAITYQSKQIVSIIARKATGETSPSDAFMPEIQAQVEMWYLGLDPVITGMVMDFNTRQAAEALAKRIEHPIVTTFGAGYSNAAVDLGKLEGANTGALGVGLIDNQYATAYARSYVPKLAREITASTRDLLRSAIEEHVNSGLPLDTLTSKIRGVLTDLSKHGAERIARTESLRAFARGNIDAMKASGVATGWKWQTSSDPCPFCEATAALVNAKAGGWGFGTPVHGLGSEIIAGGGKMLVDFLPIDQPPLHPNCYCDVEAVIDTGENP